MVECIGGHLSYLSECSSAAFQNSENSQEVRMDPLDIGYTITKLVTIFQALIAIYCDLLDFYIKVRDIFSNREGKTSCEWF